MCKLINSLVTISWIIDELNKIKSIKQPGPAILIGDTQILEPEDYILLHQRLSSITIQDWKNYRNPEAVNLIFTTDIQLLWNLTRVERFFTRSSSYIYVTRFGKMEMEAFQREVWTRFYALWSFGINCDSGDFYQFDPKLNISQAQNADALHWDYLKYGRTPNFQGIGTFKVVYFEREESFLVDEELNIIGGQDALVMKTLAERFNAKLELVEPSDGRRYGQRRRDGTVQGAYTNLLEGTAEITGNTHFLKFYGVPGLEFTHYMGVDKLCLLVPKPKKIPNYVALYQNIHYRWFYLYLASCVFGLALTTRMEKFLKMGDGMNTSAMISIVFRIFLGAPVSHPFHKTHEKIVASAFLLTTVVISNYFQGMMTTIASRPGYEKTMNTLAQIRDNRVPIIYSSREVRSYLVNDDLKRMNFIEVTVEESKAATNKNVGRTHRTYSVFTKKNMYYKGVKAAKTMLIVPECLVDYPLAYVVQTNSPLLEPINSVLSRLVESGLYLKWTIDSVPPNTYREKNRVGEQSEPDPLKNEELYFAYAILGFGHAISTMIFLAEHVVHKRNQSTKKRKKVVNRANRFQFVH